MIKKSFHPSINDNGACNDLLALYDTVDEILENKEFFTCKSFDDSSYDLEVELPVKPYKDIFHKHGTSVGTSLRNKLVYLRKKLKEVIEEQDFIKQCKILNKLFGDDFPVPDENSSGTKSSVYSNSPGLIIPNQGA